MLAIFDGEVLEVAQPGIDAAQRLVGENRGADAGFARQSGALRRLDDQRREPFAPPPVEAIGLRIFVKQKFKLMCSRSPLGPPAMSGGGKWPMVTPGDATLGLRRLAGIADDERIDHRQRSGDDFGKTFRGQRDGLARQPFQRAVRAHMHQRIGLRHVLQPQAERDQRMPRRQRRIVIVGAALRERGHGRAAAPPKACRNSWRENERRRRAHQDRPAGSPHASRKRVTAALGQPRQQAFIVLDRQHRAVVGARDSASSKSRGVFGMPLTV